MRQRADGSGTADQRREQMLRAALEVIVERGYPDTRIADVAQRAGTSPALVIYYFKTKDQLLTEAIRLSEDTWYATGTSRVAAIDTAAGRLEELIAMSCLPEEDDADAPNTSWLLWLDLWTQAARHPEVAGVRQKFDERWRDTITSLVVEGQEAGEFGPVSPADFAVTLSALLDGFAIQIALEDPTVDAGRAFELTMRFAAGELGFTWVPRHRAGRQADVGQRLAGVGAVRNGARVDR
ncbi:MAG TPA: TetR family transcriptional regulator C-terminal domain-containing protein [Streptosporangiaceae bacterium]|nr:TetR family transcriptional regulator C-terminal domain-containing protein [Streptosporangiaceae bacterium]